MIYFLVNGQILTTLYVLKDILLMWMMKIKYCCVGFRQLSLHSFRQTVFVFLRKPEKTDSSIPRLFSFSDSEHNKKENGRKWSWGTIRMIVTPRVWLLHSTFVAVKHENQRLYLSCTYPNVNIIMRCETDHVIFSAYLSFTTIASNKI